VFDATFDAQDRIETYGNLVFTYTPNGELLSKTDTSTGAVTDYTYDALGNLRGVTLPDGTQIGYLVDGFGRRVGKTLNGALVKQWLWRGRMQPVAELDGAGNVTNRFVYGEDVNAPELILTASSTLRLVKDHLGSVRQVVDVNSGIVMQDLTYDSWGRVLLDSNPGAQPFGFAGGLYDSETGLVRFGARDYDAETGRWVSKDPIGLAGGLNTSAYVKNDPVNRIDPTGRDTLFQMAWNWWNSLAPDKPNGSGDSSSSSGDASSNLFKPVSKGSYNGDTWGDLCHTPGEKDPPKSPIPPIPLDVREAQCVDAADAYEVACTTVYGEAFAAYCVEAAASFFLRCKAAASGPPIWN